MPPKRARNRRKIPVVTMTAVDRDKEDPVILTGSAVVLTSMTGLPAADRLDYRLFRGAVKFYPTFRNQGDHNNCQWRMGNTHEIARMVAGSCYNNVNPRKECEFASSLPRLIIIMTIPPWALGEALQVNEIHRSVNRPTQKRRAIYFINSRNYIFVILKS